jgi:hypothetical protein
MAQSVQDKERELEASQKRCTALLAQTNQIEHSMKVGAALRCCRPALQRCESCESTRVGNELTTRPIPSPALEYMSLLSTRTDESIDVVRALRWWRISPTWTR